MFSVGAVLFFTLRMTRSVRFVLNQLQLREIGRHSQKNLRAQT